MENLQDLRKRWEWKDKVILEIPRTIPGPELYVIIKTKTKTSDEFSLLHYFMIGDDWSVSAEVKLTPDIFECLKVLDGAFSDLIPV